MTAIKVMPKQPAEPYDAIQWSGKNDDDVEAFVGYSLLDVVGYEPKLYDWVVRDQFNAMSVLTPDEFNDRYERVESHEERLDSVNKLFGADAVIDTGTAPELLL